MSESIDHKKAEAKGEKRLARAKTLFKPEAEKYAAFKDEIKPILDDLGFVTVNSTHIAEMLALGSFFVLHQAKMPKDMGEIDKLKVSLLRSVVDYLCLKSQTEVGTGFALADLGISALAGTVPGAGAMPGRQEPTDWEAIFKKLFPGLFAETPGGAGIR